MATLVLQTVGSVVGGIVAGPLGAMAGRALGGLAGAAIDASLMGGEEGPRIVEGPRLKDVDGLTSSEGAPIPRVYGRARIGGQLIWATRLIEEANTKVERSGEQGAKGVGGGPSTVTTTYAYYANLAIGLCEGPIAFVRRIWADGRELDLTTINYRVHRGSETQDADPLILAKEGADRAPAYRGLAYVVFERLALAQFGNRVPQFSFEVIRPVDGVAAQARAVCLIPGSTEFGYDTTPIAQIKGLGKTQNENRYQWQRRTDVVASLDALQALCPKLRRVALVVSWFGDDLRAGQCTIAPRVDVTSKATDGDTWSVAGFSRSETRPVSLANGVPAYGGTPSDASVKRLIQELAARGLEVVLYPFVMMDVPIGNALPNPYGGATQPPYPWRGRITCHPAPGEAGSPDGTIAAKTQVDTWFARADGFRRMVLHYAALAHEVGHVSGFILGSELVGLTRVRSGPGLYPAVAQLRALAQDVRAVLGPDVKLVYAADWTEYGAHVRNGGEEVRFPLDPLFADNAVDAVGIDYYPPISDWRDGATHLDLAEARSAYDPAYLHRRLGEGEAFDWYYPDDPHRAAQDRVPITDGAFGKPWVFRQKDLVSWWSNPHFERVNGVETEKTAWVPKSKPIWLTEIGIPAVDKGPNGPNVFPDPKSSESAYPPFSRATRDDLAQARGLEAILSRFDPSLVGFSAADNPLSPLYDGRMVDPGSIFIWAWDARPFPVFPDFANVWADGANWETGHWITGRVEGVALDRLVSAILKDFGFASGELPLDGWLDGYVLDRPMSARAALETLTRLFGLNAVASSGDILWSGRGGRSVIFLDAEDFVLPERDLVLRIVRLQETELPLQVEIGFTESEEGEYRRAAVASRRLSGTSRREARADMAIVTRRAEAQRLADAWLQDLWAGRETAEFEISPRRLDIEPGDVLSLSTPSGARLHRVVRITDGATRKLSTRAVEPAVFETPGSSAGRPVRVPPAVPGKPEVVVLDLPVASGTPEALQFIAVAADPWPGAVTVWRSGDGTSFKPKRFVDLPAVIGTTLSPLGPGPLWRFDPKGSVDLRISTGSIASVTDDALLGGDNLFALRGQNGRWEILSAGRAELIGERTYRLSRLLRGLGGTESEAARAVTAGALVVRLDEGVVPLTSDLADLGRTWFYRVGPSGRDHGDASMAAFAATVGPLALRPYDPVHLVARREEEGIRIAWHRRSRIGSDGWDLAEIPLGEASERYEIDILNGTTPLRRLSATEPSLLYPTVQEIVDFGAPQTTLSVAVAQLSTAVGRGLEVRATLRVL